MIQVICHGIPDQRELEDGDIVNVDVTAYIGGFHGDLNETFTVGEVSSGRAALAGQCIYDVDISGLPCMV